MFYINKIYNVKNQTKLIYSFRSQNSGYFLGKESSDLEEVPKRFLDNIDIPFAIIHFALCIFCAFLEYMSSTNRNIILSMSVCLSII